MIYLVLILFLLAFARVRTAIGAFLIGLLLGLLGCGGGAPAPKRPVSFAEVETVVNRRCAGCHDGKTESVLLPREKYLRSGAQSRVREGTMPPGGGLTAEERNILLEEGA